MNQPDVDEGQEEREYDLFTGKYEGPVIERKAWDCVRLSADEKNALLSALDGFEPDTASYNPDDTMPMGWSPADVAALDSAYEKIMASLKETD